MSGPKKNSVLVVDNDRFLCDLVQSDLSQAGFNVVLAYGGHEAFNIVRTYPLEVVVASLRMGKGDGWELLQRIRDFNPKFPSVILMVEPDEDVSPIDLVDAGASGVLKKPIEGPELISKIDFAIVSQIEEKSFYDRAGTRQETSFQAELMIPGLERYRLVEIVDLSKGGFGFSIRGASVDVGTVVTFRMHTKDRKLGSIEGFGVVRWTAKDRDRPKDLLLGVQFIDPKPDMISKIETLIEAQSVVKSQKKAG